MKKRCCLAGLCLLLGLLWTLPAFAASMGSKATGARLPQYSKVVTVKVDTTDFKKGLRSALEKAQKNATDKVQYKIVIPKGTYETNWNITVPSNTHVYAVGAVIHYKEGSKNIFVSRLDGSSRNIKIEGGTWTTTRQSAGYAPDSSPIRMAHIKNLWLKNLTVKCNRGGHIIELADMNGLTIEDCKLSGNNKYRGVQPKEAIQLDVASSGAMVNYKPYNGKGCHNVIIRGNTFSDIARGVGSHSESGKGIERYPYTDITVTGNTMRNIKGEGIFVLNWRNCSIGRNTINNGSRAGIYMESCTYVRARDNRIYNIKSYTGQRRSIYGAQGAGIILRVSSSNQVTGNYVQRYATKSIVQEGICKGNKISGNKSKKS